MAKKYAVDLSKEEQGLLNELITSGTQRVRKTNHARILLKADAGWTDEVIAEGLNVYPHDPADPAAFRAIKF